MFPSVWWHPHSQDLRVMGIPLEILLFMLNLLISWCKWGVLRMMPGDAYWSRHQMIPRGRVQLSLFSSFSKINTLQYIYHIKWPLCTLRGISHFRKRICYTMLHPYSCFVFRIPSFLFMNCHAWFICDALGKTPEGADVGSISVETGRQLLQR